MDSLLFISANQIDQARLAMERYTAWEYLNPNASDMDRLNQQFRAARFYRLTSEGKVYMSVMVNEYHRKSVSRYGSDAPEDGR